MGIERKDIRNDDFRTKPILGDRLWDALNQTLDVLGPSLKKATIIELEKNGLDFKAEAGKQSHTLAELKDKLVMIFGDDGSDVILEQVAKKLINSKSDES
ncbi:MAG TPA: hypothetical protein VIE86_05000 [Nitrososphaera sp.]|jgi:hypothetical protein